MVYFVGGMGGVAAAAAVGCTAHMDTHHRARYTHGERTAAQWTGSRRHVAHGCKVRRGCMLEG